MSEQNVHCTGMKYDGDKVRVELLVEGMPLALMEVSKVLTMGAVKYADHSWQNVPNASSRYLGAQMRHLLAALSGEDKDEESEIVHLAHEACDCLFRLELLLRELRRRQTLSDSRFDDQQRQETFGPLDAQSIVGTASHGTLMNTDFMSPTKGGNN